MNKKFILLLFCIIALTNIKANDIDSLKQIIYKLPDSKEKVDQLNVLALYCRLESKFDSSIIVCNEVLELASQINYPNGLGEGYQNHGLASDLIGNIDVVMKQYNKAIDIYKQEGNKLGLAETYLLIGGFYFYTSELEKSRDFTERSLEIFTDINNQIRISDAYAMLGNIYNDGINTIKSLDYFLKAITLKESLDLDKEGERDLTFLYSNTGNFYLENGNNKQCIDYTLKALKNLIQFRDYANASISSANISDAYFKEKNYQKSKEYAHIALKYAEETNYKYGQVYALKKIGDLNIIDFKNNTDSPYSNIYLDSAYNRYEVSKAYSKDLNSEYGIGLALNGMAEVEYLRKNYKNSIYLYNKTLLTKAKLIDKQKAYDGLYQSYLKLGDYKNALYNHEQFKLVTDSLTNIESINSLKKIEAEAEYRKEQQRKAEKIERINDRNFLQYSGAFLFIIFLFLIFNFSDRFNFSILVTKAGVFLTILLLFEFILVYLDPYIDNWTDGAPAYKLMINSTLAAFIFPLHNLLERRMSKNKKS